MSMEAQRFASKTGISDPRNWWSRKEQQISLSTQQPILLSNSDSDVCGRTLLCEPIKVFTPCKSAIMQNLWQMYVRSWSYSG